MFPYHVLCQSTICLLHPRTKLVFMHYSQWHHCDRYRMNFRFHVWLDHQYTTTRAFHTSLVGRFYTRTQKTTYQNLPWIASLECNGHSKFDGRHKEAYIVQHCSKIVPFFNSLLVNSIQKRDRPNQSVLLCLIQNIYIYPPMSWLMACDMPSP